jgi:hypothetical protein
MYEIVVEGGKSSEKTHQFSLTEDIKHVKQNAI